MTQEDEAQYKAELEKARQAWQAQQRTEPPELKRDIFEYPEEFKERVEKNGPYLAGTATLLKDQYEVVKELFPIEIQWEA